MEQTPTTIGHPGAVDAHMVLLSLKRVRAVLACKTAKTACFLCPPDPSGRLCLVPLDGGKGTSKAFEKGMKVRLRYTFEDMRGSFVSRIEDIGVGGSIWVRRPKVIDRRVLGQPAESAPEAPKFRPVTLVPGAEFASRRRDVRFDVRGMEHMLVSLQSGAKRHRLRMMDVSQGGVGVGFRGGQIWLDVGARYPADLVVEGKRLAEGTLEVRRVWCEVGRESRWFSGMRWCDLSRGQEDRLRRALWSFARERDRRHEVEAEAREVAAARPKKAPKPRVAPAGPPGKPEEAYRASGNLMQLLEKASSLVGD